VLFVIAEKDARVKNDTNAIAALKLLKGPADVVSIPANHLQINNGAAFDAAAKAAVEWFLKHL